MVTEHRLTPAGVVAAGPGTSDAAGATGEPEVSTGDAAVDEALSRLVGIDGEDLRGQLVTFEAVHGALQDRLADAEG